MMRVDSTQWPTAKIVASVNNYLDMIVGYAIGQDKRFQWDDTNHSALPEGTTNIVANQSDYSFLTDQQGNTILTLTRIEMLNTNGHYSFLRPVDMVDFDPNSITELEATAGTPMYYDKIADNIVRLYPKPLTSVSAGLKFYFQRTPSYFLASDTTKAPGVAPILHRGFVVAAAYDGALTLGLDNLNALAVEQVKETKKMQAYFSARNNDDRGQITTRVISFR